MLTVSNYRKQIINYLNIFNIIYTNIKSKENIQKLCFSDTGCCPTCNQPQTENGCAPVIQENFTVENGTCVSDPITVSVCNGECVSGTE